MLRTGLSILAATFVTAGAASAQTDYGGQGYGRQGGYAQPSPNGAPQGASQDNGGYDDDDRAPPPGAGRAQADATYAGADQTPPDLGRDLALRPDQRAALQAYQQATDPSEAEQRQMQADEQRLAGLTTPQRLDFAAAQMRRDEADFARRADAVRRFYAQLTPQQQHRFDQLTGPDAGGAPGGYGGDTGAPPPR